MKEQMCRTTSQPESNDPYNSRQQQFENSLEHSHINRVVAVRPTIYKERFLDQQAYAIAYSNLKFGSYTEVQSGAADITTSLTSDLAAAIRKEPQKWCVLSIGTHLGYGLPCAAILLANAVASRIGVERTTIPLGGSNRESLPSKKYEELSSKEDRSFVLNQEIERGAFPNLAGKQVILIDDCYVSGNFIETVSTQALLHGASCVVPLVLHRFDALGDHSFESVVNLAGLKGSKSTFLKTLWSDQKTSITTRLVTLTASLSEEEVVNLLSSLPPFAALNFLATSLVYFGRDAPCSGKAAFFRILPELYRENLFDNTTLQGIEALGKFLTNRWWRNTEVTFPDLVRAVRTC
jgi:hypothetical protein